MTAESRSRPRRMPRNRRPEAGNRLLGRPPLHLPTALLASSLERSQVDKQSACRLMQLPVELRDRIFFYVFTAEGIPAPLDETFKYARSWESLPRVHTSLLRTCRAVYLEAHLLPVTLNPVYGFHGSKSLADKPGANLISLLWGQLPDFLSAWQFSALNHLVLTMHQSDLEQQPLSLASYASCLLACYGRCGIRVAAKDGHGKDMWPKTSGGGRSRLELEGRPIGSTARYHVRRAAEDAGGLGPFYAASTISHLTIRLDRADWWTWDSNPTPQEGDDGLALDPWLGGGSGQQERPLVSQMMELYNGRRACRDAGEEIAPCPAGCWGRRVALFRGLRRLTLHLETFRWRVEELDRIIECAKLWSFLIDEDLQKGQAGRVLSWDGKLTAYSWGQEQPFPQNWEHPTAPKGFEVRIISFC